VNVWLLDLQLPMQSVTITTYAVSSNLDQGEVYNIMCCLVVFNATFNYISVISGRSFFLIEETGGPGENYRLVSSR
jgi:hypothetical protein